MVDQPRDRNKDYCTVYVSRTWRSIQLPHNLNIYESGTWLSHYFMMGLQKIQCLACPPQNSSKTLENFQKNSVQGIHARTEQHQDNDPKLTPTNATTVCVMIAEGQSSTLNHLSTGCDISKWWWLGGRRLKWRRERSRCRSRCEYAHLKDTKWWRRIEFYFREVYIRLSLISKPSSSNNQDLIKPRLMSGEKIEACKTPEQQLAKQKHRCKRFSNSIQMTLWLFPILAKAGNWRLCSANSAMISHRNFLNSLWDVVIYILCGSYSLQWHELYTKKVPCCSTALDNVT